MEITPIARLLSTYVLFTCTAVSLFVSPWNSIDPINLPKLVALGILSTIAFSLVLSDLSFIKSAKSRPILIVLGLFVVQLLLALIFSSEEISFHLYGTPGRNTGFFAYLFLSFLLIASATTASFSVLKKFLFSLLGVECLLEFRPGLLEFPCRFCGSTVGLSLQQKDETFGMVWSCR